MTATHLCVLILTGASISHAQPDALEKPSAARLLEGTYLNKAVLRQANLGGAHLVRVDLSGADLTGVDLTGGHLREVDLNGADFQDPQFGRTRRYGRSLPVSARLRRSADVSQAAPAVGLRISGFWVPGTGI